MGEGSERFTTEKGRSKGRRPPRLEQDPGGPINGNSPPAVHSEKGWGLPGGVHPTPEASAAETGTQTPARPQGRLLEGQPEHLALGLAAARPPALAHAPALTSNGHRPSRPSLSPGRGPAPYPGPWGEGARAAALRGLPMPSCGTHATLTPTRSAKEARGRGRAGRGRGLARAARLAGVCGQPGRVPGGEDRARHRSQHQGPQGPGGRGAEARPPLPCGRSLSCHQRAAAPATAGEGTATPVGDGTRSPGREPLASLCRDSLLPGSSRMPGSRAGPRPPPESEARTDGQKVAKGHLGLAHPRSSSLIRVKHPAPGTRASTSPLPGPP